MRYDASKSDLINNICLFQDDAEVNQLIRDLSNELGFPRVKRVLTLYFENEIRLRCDENNLFLGRRISVKTTETWREAKFKSKFLGTLLNVLFGAGLKSAALSNVIQLSFPEDQEASVIYLSDTLISEHQFEILCHEDAKFKSETIQKILKNKIDKDKLIHRTSKIVDESLVDDLGVLNEKVINFCKQVNLSLSLSTTTSYFHQISAVSNDYGELVTVFEQITGYKMLGSAPTPKIYTADLPSVSIIIPAFNLGESIIKTLKSIDRQTPDVIKFEVIVVDDGSKEPVSEIIKKVQDDLRYEPIIIRKEKNSGISQTRNIGAAVSSNDILLFIDGDVVLTPNYLYEHLLRHKLVNKALLVSFKENAEPTDVRISYDAVKRGVVMPNYSSDLRITKYIDKDTMGYYSNNYLAQGDIFSILSETNYFRTLGFGRRLGNFDLPSMVVGHNLSIPKNLFYATGGFDNKFSGYGLEDSLIGIKAISAGAFIIPVLACGVYHINHPTRRGTMEEIRKEFEINSDLIAKFLSGSE
ncbi:hypothetical protein A3K29_03930 [Candidatus Collierbacteria bacterium RIFOXYB2_FULL_46_14]|uniref:Glycosyl transferase, group 2 family protein n=1 Tax=Candidatus Collierbacteria bacterium GW2011_GWA2_46_26 TaxID=1618381 RepID=A0A0G1PIT2_9BACT|nr:MAG: Glycosyl transferase, group 2 family protein [Candidatus Collierbacteria bacterium GW2011_GWC2_44_13]KKU32661.1 MAG: Glycosyl transferase, group 2 family protein [Candidatus Collierbacteria bacterium GW2011_GWA2_46_26]OGD73262.1 MAG: hypothetical protein A3K29_03930 [Candidatus Collierbacteria bacterium RIFOXYB2_FULL_46_14]OGD76304.1 MAG: hypothetical protein A3K43_03930 [Candidatus Collierbacteria bacterium RIFOXYA2_FULL_46_20]OGD77640.1 MAG: hypothetical protein A3K39_03930 [Candidatu